MKTFKLIFIVVFVLLSSFPHTCLAQEETNSQEFSPAIIVYSTFYLVNDANKDFSDWKKIEKEYFDKITSKNDFILGSGVYTHLISPDDSEVIFVNVYNSWEDIELSKKRTEELIAEGWENEQDRADFFKIQNEYYNGERKDEIVLSLPFQKDLETDSKDPLIYYVRKNHTGNGGSGYKEFFDNIIMKNDYIKGYYTHKQLYGSNTKDATEIAVFESLADFEDSYDETIRLVKEYWPNEKERKEFFKEFRKIFNGHGDYIYQNVPELAK